MSSGMLLVTDSCEFLQVILQNAEFYVVFLTILLVALWCSVAQTKAVMGNENA